VVQKHRSVRFAFKMLSQVWSILESIRANKMPSQTWSSKLYLRSASGTGTVHLSL